MKKIGFIFSTLLMLGSTSLWAEESANLKLGGEISPSACMASFDSDGTIDYGTMSSGQLSETEYTVLDTKQIVFNIKCNEPTKVGFSLQSGRLGTLAGGTEGEGGFGLAPVPLLSVYESGNFAAGIGLDSSGNKIGGVSIRNSGNFTVVDGETIHIARHIAVEKDGKFNARMNYGQAYWGGKIFTFSTRVESEVARPFETLLATYDVKAYLNKASELDLSKEINMDGLITFELNYL